MVRSLDKSMPQGMEPDQKCFHLAPELERVPAIAKVVAIVEVGNLLSVTIAVSAFVADH